MKDNMADTVVIGAGIVGSSIAFRLAKKGQKVILLDKNRVGEEASLRNTGGVRQQDRDTAELPLAKEAVKIWADMKDELDCDVGYRRGGQSHDSTYGGPDGIPAPDHRKRTGHGSGR